MDPLYRQRLGARLSLGWSRGGGPGGRATWGTVGGELCTIQDSPQSRGARRTEVFRLFTLRSPAFGTAERSAEGEAHYRSEAEERELGLGAGPQSRGLACGQDGRSEGLGTRLSAAPGLP